MLDHQRNKDIVIYTCPMHPEVKQAKPGSCPKCGMALEALITKSADMVISKELSDMMLRFIICAILALPLFLLAMVGHFVSFSIVNENTSNILQFILASPIVIWGGWPFFIRGWRSIIIRNFNMFTLLSLGIGVAYIYSLIALFLTSPDLKMEVYFEASGVITTLALLGQVLELKARSHVGSAIKALLNLTPKSAHILIENQEEDIPIDEVKVGDYLRVKPGEKVPLDGEIIEGSSFIDESMITGEAELVEKRTGSKVIGATLNSTGSFIMKVIKTGEDTMLSQIITMVLDAQRSKAPIQKLADIISSYFVPSTLIIAIITAICWYIWGPEPKLHYIILNSVGVLIIACPCALGLATPMSIMVGTEVGAKSGILIKNAESLETLEKIDILVVDKTGTLTEGRPELTLIKTFGDYSEEELLILAASIEQNSEHPLGKAIVKAATEKNLVFVKTSDFKSITGKGAAGFIGKKSLAIGNMKLFENNQAIKSDLLKLDAELEDLRKSGNTVMLLAINNKLEGLLAVSDKIKSTSYAALKELRKNNIRVIMLTGDNKTTAEAVAKKLEISEIYAEVTPEYKLTIIEGLQKQGLVVAMAGDGINDAPALAKANIGIAMGTGTDVAIESAGITLVRGDISGIIRAYLLSKATMSNIKQNLFFAFGYNALSIPIAAGLLYPWFGILLNPMIASVVMALSSVSVIYNSLRLYRS